MCLWQGSHSMVPVISLNHWLVSSIQVYRVYGGYFVQYWVERLIPVCEEGNGRLLPNSSNPGESVVFRGLT